jgi:hypothetical protein
MNNRIQELIQQSMPEIDWKARHGVELNNGERLEHMSNWFDKFAELIVEECRYVMDCNKGSDQNPAWNQALWETSEKIKKHFGISSSDNIRAGAEIHSDKGYSVGTQEKYEEAKRRRERK